MAKTSSNAGPSAAERFHVAGSALIQKLAKFGVVGGVAYILDVGVFNLLCYWGPEPVLEGRPFLAKVVSTIIATIAAWLGNRYWTFRKTRRQDAHRELLLYIVMCTIGLGISLACLWISHKVLGLTSPLADNIAANVVGLAAATTFRFWSYQRFVFIAQRPKGSQGHKLAHEMRYSSPGLGEESPALSES